MKEKSSIPIKQTTGQVSQFANHVIRKYSECKMGEAADYYTDGYLPDDEDDLQPDDDDECCEPDTSPDKPIIRISTVIKKICMEEKFKDLKRDGYFFEYKEMKSHWVSRLEKLIPIENPTEITFLVGSIPFKFRVTSIEKVLGTWIPSKYQAIANPNNTVLAYAIKCEEL
jgi:hypothetical protein